MRKFWIIYIVVAVVGSAGVYFLAPWARPLMERCVKQGENKVVADNSKFMSSTFVSAGDYDNSLPVDMSAEVVTNSVIQSGDVFDDPPALIGIYRATGRDKPKWGVTRIKTNLYADDGRHLGEVPAGIVANYQDVRVSSMGSMVLCTLLYKGKEHGPGLLKQKDICLFTGDYMKLSKDQRGNLEAYYKTKGAMEERKIDLMHQFAIQNPYYTSYKAAYDGYMAHIGASKKLSMTHDITMGLKRSRLEDQLRKMKNEEAKLQKRYNAIHAKYKGWKDQNAAKLPDTVKDSRVREYRIELRRLARLIPGLAY